MTDRWTLVRYGTTARVSSDGTDDKVYGTPGKVGSKQGQDTVGRYYPWGYDSRMPVGGQALLAAPNGSSANVAMVGARHSKYRPDYGDDKWSTILFNEVDGTYVKLRQDGGVQVAGKGALLEIKSEGSLRVSDKDGGVIEVKGGTIKINGGTAAVNRQGDQVTLGKELGTWMTSVTAALKLPAMVGSVIGATGAGSPKVLVP